MLKLSSFIPSLEWLFTLGLALHILLVDSYHWNPSSLVFKCGPDKSQQISLLYVSSEYYTKRRRRKNIYYILFIKTTSKGMNGPRYALPWGMK